jgi:hypothetical protein
MPIETEKLLDFLLVPLAEQFKSTGERNLREVLQRKKVVTSKSAISRNFFTGSVESSSLEALNSDFVPSTPCLRTQYGKDGANAHRLILAIGWMFESGESSS